MCHPKLAQTGSIRAEAMEWLAQFANNHTQKIHAQKQAVIYLS